jgi:hypothetical protein
MLKTSVHFILLLYMLIVQKIIITKQVNYLENHVYMHTVRTYENLVLSTIPDKTPVYIQDKANATKVAVFPGVLPVEVLQQLYKDVLDRVDGIPLINNPHDVRGTQKAFSLGHYLPRGAGETKEDGLLTSDFHDKFGAFFFQKYKQLWDLISNLMKEVDMEFYTTLMATPEEYRPMGIFSLLFCNLVPPKNAHVDTKDVKWCGVFYFGDFDTTKFYLHSLRMTLTCSMGDFVFLQSRCINHQADRSVAKKMSMVVTAHTGVINKVQNRIIDL